MSDDPVTMTSTQAVHLLEQATDQDPRTARLGVRDLALAPLQVGEILVGNSHVSVDPSALGRMLKSEKHYTSNFAVGAPLDGWAVGTVLASRAEQLPVGTTVRHFRGWREHAILPADQATVVDRERADAPEWLSTLGVSGLTAWVALTKVASLQPGETVFVSSAAGAVGTTVVQLARCLGAGRVIGSAGGQAKGRLVEQLGADAVIDRRDGDLDAALREAAPEGIDVYVDSVGGDHLAAALRAMREGGRVALVGMMTHFDPAASRPDLGILMEAVLKRVRLEGFIALDHLDAWDEYARQALEWRDQGRLRAVHTIAEGLEQGIDALLGLTGDSHVGKSLVGIGGRHEISWV